MPNWKKVLVSGSNAELGQVTASLGFTGSFTGDGFHKPVKGISGGGQTGATIETLLAYGATVVTNPDEKELENSSVIWLERIAKKYES